MVYRTLSVQNADKITLLIPGGHFSVAEDNIKKKTYLYFVINYMLEGKSQVSEVITLLKASFTL